MSEKTKRQSFEEMVLAGDHWTDVAELLQVSPAEAETWLDGIEERFERDAMRLNIFADQKMHAAMETIANVMETAFDPKTKLAAAKELVSMKFKLTRQQTRKEKEHRKKMKAQHSDWDFGR